MKKGIQFLKISGSGNDFVVVDNRLKAVKRPAEFAKKYCDRKFGIGADGLLLVEKSKKQDFKMAYFNSDGSRADFCGNGSRCISLFAYINGIAGRKMSFESDAGLISAEIAGENAVKVKMPNPRNIKLDFTLDVDGKKTQASFVDTGVPHIVIFVDEIGNIDVETLGKKIRWHRKFRPAGTNVNFVKITGGNKFSIRTYERGVEGETLACGTGTVASALISIMKKYVASPVSALTKGGEVLKVYSEGNNIFFEGKVSAVFDGRILK